MAIIKTGAARNSITPDLNLDFANSKQLDSSIRFEREGMATYYDSKGILRYAGPNQPRFDHNPETGECKGLLIEGSSSTAVVNSSMLSYFGDHTGFITLYAGVAPDGTYSAYKFGIGGAGQAQVRRLYNFSTPTNARHGFSCFFKNIDAATAVLNWGDNGQTGSVTFTLNFSTEEATASGTSSWNPRVRLEKLPRGWFRLCGSFLLPSGASATTVPHVRITGSSGQSAYVWGAQTEISMTSNFVGSYIPYQIKFTTRDSRATYHDENGVLRIASHDKPRYGYKYDSDTGKWVETGYINETTATNYLPINADCRNRGSASDAELDGTLAPDGSPAYIFKPTTATTLHRVGYYGDPSLGSGNICYSVYLKAGGYRYVAVNNYHSGSQGAGFDLQTGTIVAVGANCHANIEDVGNGWYRCSVGYASTNTNDTMNIEIRNTSGATYESFAGDGSSGVYVWGMQMENSLTASSYIYTDGTARTRLQDNETAITNVRAMDVAQIENVQDSDWHREEQGTFYTEHETFYDIEDIETNYRIIERHNYSGDNVAAIIHNGGTDQLNAGMYNNSGWQALIGVASPYGVVDKGVVYKSAFAYSVDDFAVSFQGSSVATDTSGSITKENTSLQLGNNSALSAPLNGHLKIVRFYGDRLSNGELEALTEE